MNLADNRFQIEKTECIYLGVVIGWDEDGLKLAVCFLKHALSVVLWRGKK